MDKKHYLLGLFKDTKITYKVSMFLNTQRPRLKDQKEARRYKSCYQQQGHKPTRMLNTEGLRADIQVSLSAWGSPGAG